MTADRLRQTFESACENSRNELFAEAIEQLGIVIDHASTPPSLLELALYERAGARRRSGQIEEARRDYARLLARELLEPALHPAVLFDRGTTHLLAKNHADAIGDYSALLDLERLSADIRAQALVNRGYAYREDGRAECALADWQAVAEIEDAPVEQRYRALANVCEIHLDQNQHQLAAAALVRASEFGRTEGLRDPDPNDLLLAAAETASAAGDWSVSILLFDRLLSAAYLAGWQKSRALIGRAEERRRSGDLRGARTDARAVLRMRVVSQADIARAREFLESLVSE